MMTRKFHSRTSCTRCSGKAQPGTVNLMGGINARFSYTSSWGIYNCRNIAGTTSLSQHACGRAGDSRIPTLSGGAANTALGNPIVRLLVDNAWELGLTAVIYNRVIYDARSPNGRVYTGAHPHNDHIHWEQTPTASTSITRAQVEDILGHLEGEIMLIQKGSKGQIVAEWQKMMAEGFSQNNGTWSPFSGRSPFDQKTYAAGQDGSFGDTAERNTKNVQKALNQTQTGKVDDLLWDAVVRRVYGSGASTGGLTKAEADKLYQKLGTIPGHGHEYAPKVHGHKGTVVEKHEVTLT